MKLTTEDRNLIAFALVLAAIGVFIKVGGGTNLAIITPLLTLLGAIGQGFRKSSPHEKDQP